MKLCQACKIAQKKCEGGVIDPPGDTVVIRHCPTAAVSTAPSTPKARVRKDKGSATGSSVAPPLINLSAVVL